VSRRAGFTLLEMLVAVGSSLAILAAVGGFARGQTRMVDRECRRLRLMETSRRVLDTIAREIRGAGFAPVAGGFDGAADGLFVAGRNRIELRADLHGPTGGDPPDGLLDADSDERIGFALNATRGSISQTIGRQSVPLTLDGAVPADGLSFRYFDACDLEVVPARGGELAAEERPRVRRIAVALSVRETRDALVADVTATLRNRQTLRCE
jgi:type II secretory pathway pseudopilin PulG